MTKDIRTAWTLITLRYILAIVFSLYFLAVPVKDDWYVIYLLILNAIFQFVWATFQMWEYIKEIKNKI